MPFGSKGEFKSWIKDYVRNVRQTLKGNGVAQEEIKKCVQLAPSSDISRSTHARERLVYLPLTYSYYPKPTPPKRFMEEAPTFVKWLVDKYDDLEFFMGKSMNPDAGLIYSYYKDGALAPTFVYIKAGYKVSKF